MFQMRRAFVRDDAVTSGTPLGMQRQNFKR